MSLFNKSSNPFLNEDKINQSAQVGVLDHEQVLLNDHASVNGAISKTLLLAGILLITTIYSYTNPSMPLMYIGVFGAAGVMFLTHFKPHLAPYTGPVFAALEGLFVGAVSVMYAAAYAGIVAQALSLTMSVLFVMLVIYRARIIPVTQKLRTGVSMAVGAVMLVYLISWLGHFVGFKIPFIHSSGPIGIVICLVIIGIASLNLLLDFDQIERAEAQSSPKYMEWYCAMGLLFTLVWLYVEFLRLLSKLKD